MEVTKSIPRPNGTKHWLLQRVSAVLAVPLFLWMIISARHYVYSDYEVALVWISKPFNAFVLELTLLILLFHAQLGITVITEDYVKGSWQKILIQLSAFVLTITALWTAVATIMLIVK